MTGAREPAVLYIVGKGRSGSTLLDTMLGEVDGFFSTGELWRRWGGRRLRSYPCGCGSELGECSVWAPVLDRALTALSDRLGREVSDADVLRWEEEVARWHRIPRLLRQSPPVGGEEWEGETGWTELRDLALFASVLYRELATAVDARVIVDSSKWPAHLGPLGLVPRVRSHVVHLVRDPRAVAYSWQRSRRFLDEGPRMPRFGPVHSALSWSARNGVAEAVRSRAPARSLLLRYEDLISEPGPRLREILALVGEEGGALPLVGERTVRLGPNHTVWGNPSRFERGPVELREDREWRSELGAGAAATTVALTAPLLLRYGYPLRRRR